MRDGRPREITSTVEKSKNPKVTGRSNRSPNFSGVAARSSFVYVSR
jgi:hypothetical protein